MPDTARLTAALSDRYRIERELGAGGMATVYLATDLKHQREVALKVLRPELAAVLGAERFLAEISITARLDHPHILTLIDSGEAGGLLYYVLPFVRGESLRARLERERQLGLDDALMITRQVAAALAYAHEHGVIHRDIKPENILLHEGEAVLADFGIALALREAGGNRLTETGLSLGTPQYMSPEQATGDRALDARSDVYSLAAVLYEMLAGEPPVTGPTAQAMIAKLMTERPTRLRIVRDTVPDGIDAAVAKALAKVPADRFGSAADFAKALGVTTAAAPRGARRASRRLVAGGAVLLLAVVAVVVGRPLLSHRGPPRPPFDPIQLTVTGKAYDPVLAPDGSQVAYTSETCDDDGLCTYRLVIRETDADVERPVAEGTGLWAQRWSPDGRWLLFIGTFRDRAPGLFVVSRSGGAPLRLLDANADFLPGGDTVVAARPPIAGVPPFLYSVLTATGRILDSVPLGGTDASEWPEIYAAPGGKWIASLRYPRGKPGRAIVMVHDRSGRALDSLERAAFDGPVRWAAASDAVLLLLEDSAGRVGPSLVRLAVDGRGRFGRPDTLVPGATGARTAMDHFDVSADGGTLAYAGIIEGENEVRVYSAGRGTAAPALVRRVRTATLNLHSHVSDDGQRILMLANSGPGRNQILVAAFDSGAGRPVTPVIDRWWDWIDTRDARRLYVLTEDRPGSAHLTAYDVATGASRSLVDLPLRARLWRGPNGGLTWVDDRRDSIHVLDSAGATVTVLAIPPALGLFEAANVSPDQREMLVLLDPPSSDSQAAFVRIAIADGRIRPVTRLPNFTNFQTHNPDWTSDGWIHLVMRQPRDPAYRMYRVRADGGPIELERALPQNRNGIYTMSADGRRWTSTRNESRSDIYLVRGTRMWP